MSLVFNFDSAVFCSYVYNRVFRGSLKDHLRQQQQQKELRSLNHPDSDQTNDEANDTVGINEQDKTYSALPDSDFPNIRFFHSDLPHSYMPDSDLPEMSLNPPVLRDQDLTVIQSCEAKMLQDYCYTFATRYNNRLETADTEHALPNFDEQVGLITRQDVQTHANW